MSTHGEKRNEINEAINSLGTVIKKKFDQSVTSTDVRRIERVTESNYPAEPEPDILYIVIAD